MLLWPNNVIEGLIYKIMLRMRFINRCIDAFQIFKQAKVMSAFSLVGIMIGVAACAVFLRLESISMFNYQQAMKALGENEFVATLLPYHQDEQTESDYVHWQHFLEKNKPLQLIPFLHFSIEETTFLAVPSDFFTQFQLQLISGRVLTDLDRFSNVAMVGRLHPMATHLGEHFLIKEDWVRVIGVLDGVMSPLIQVDLNQAVLVHLGLPERLGWSKNIDMVWGKGDRWRFKAYFELYFKGYGLHFRDASFYLQQFSKQLDSYQNLLLQISVLAFFLGALSFGNLRLLSLYQRRQEIGIRMAMGARASDIAILFLIESVVLGSLGGIVGCLLAEGITLWIVSGLEWVYYIFIGPHLAALVLSIALSLLAGLYPALQAARLKPSSLLTSHL